MCLVLLSYKQQPGYRLVLAANRDEFLDRPTATLDYHFHGESILAGKDLQHGGTWLGLVDNGRLAAITNYRDPVRVIRSAPSRGELVLRFLRSRRTPAEFIQGLAQESKTYNGFNLLLADNRGLYYFSNITGQAKELEPGLYGLSNHLLNTPWPKVERGREMLQNSLIAVSQPDQEEIFSVLRNESRPDDALLPETGVGLEWEKILSPIFIHSSNYGTRSSAVILVTDEGYAEFHERSYAHGEGVREVERKSYALDISQEIAQ